MPIQDTSDFGLQSAQLARRQQMADMLRKQSMEQSSGDMVSGHYIAPSWSQGLNKMAQALVGNKMQGEVDSGQQALADAVRGKTNAEWAGVSSDLAGREAIAQPEDGQQGPWMPAQAANPAAAYSRALQSQDPALKQFGMQGMAQLPQMAERKAERAQDIDWRAQQAKAQIDAANVAHQRHLEVLQSQNANAETIMKANQAHAEKMQRLAASYRPAPQAQIIQTAEGPAQLVNGRAVPIIGADGKPVQGMKQPGTMPEVAKQKDAFEAISLLQQAAPLIRGATGSGVGAATDWVAGMVGMAPNGAAKISKLKAISGMLVAKMPKMSGPQSDKDVQLYREMAGNIGDPSIPNSLKEEAMKTIAEIQARYAGIQTPDLDFSGKTKPGASGGWAIQPVGE